MGPPGRPGEHGEPGLRGDPVSGGWGDFCCFDPGTCELFAYGTKVERN